MIIQNANTNPGSPPVRLASDDAPKVVLPKVVAHAPEQMTDHQPDQQPSVQQLNSAVDAINHAMRQSSRSVEFSVDTSTKKPVIKMVDALTGELVRQIPSKEVLAIAQSIDEFMQRQGLLFNHKA